MRRREILCEASVENIRFGCNPGERACQQVLRARQLLTMRLFQFEDDGLGNLATSSAGFKSI